MFKQPLFWFGLLVGSLTAYGFSQRSLRGASDLPALPLELIDDALAGNALMICDSAGEVLHRNSAAQTLFGSQGDSHCRLGYLSGQAVPPGQLPLTRALRSETKIETQYLFTDANQVQRILGVSAQALPGGGAAALFRDLTVDSAEREQREEAKRQQRIVQNLCRRLNKTVTVEETARAIAENTSELFLYPAEAQVRLYSYSSEAQTLTRLALNPVDRLKGVKTAAHPPSVFPFNAQEETLWQIYLLRQPCAASLTLLGEPPAASALAVPLIAGGVAIGHLGLSSETDGRFDDPGLQETLQLIAALAALALSAPKSAALASALSRQVDALREVTQAAAAGTSAGRLADLVTGQIRRITEAEVCVLSLDVKGKLTVVGEAVQDDLLLPRTAPNAPLLHGKAVQKAWRTQKIVTQIGTPNLLETGPWRVLAGNAGAHLVTALPLASRSGVLTVYKSGTAPLPEPQIAFLETLAAVFSLSLRTATAGANRAD